MPGLPTLSTFSGVSPPWNLASLDANFANIATLLKSVNNYTTYALDTGAANAYVVTLAGTLTYTLTAGAMVVFKATNANAGGASTLNVNATGVKSIVNQDGSALSVNQIPGGGVIPVVYDGTNYIILLPVSALLAASAAEIKTGTVSTKYIAPDQLLAAQGFTARYNSGNQTITSGGALTLAHGLGREPIVVVPWLKCLTAENGYSIGDKQLCPLLGDDPAASRGVSVVANATNVVIRFGANGNAFKALDKSSGSAVALTNANWAFIVEAFA